MQKHEKYAEYLLNQNQKMQVFTLFYCIYLINLFMIGITLREGNGIMRIQLSEKVRQGLKISLALLSIPLIAWVLEFAYTHYLSPRFRRTTTPHMILSNHGLEGYDYAMLNSLLRKVRRLEMHHDRSTHEFLHSPQFAQRTLQVLTALETEQTKFVAYYYDTLDMYTKTSMPLKLRRRLHYYRSIIRRGIGRSKQLARSIGLPEALFED